MVWSAINQFGELMYSGKVVVGAALVFLAANLTTSHPVAAGDYPFASRVGQHGWIDAAKDGWWICRSEDDLSKFRDLAVNEDDSAAAVKVFEKDCTHVKTGTEVVVEKTAWFSSDLCVRPIGEPECGWIKPGFVTTVPCPTCSDGR